MKRIYWHFGEDSAMTYRGHVKNGVVLLDEPVGLPDGTEVDVSPRGEPGDGAEPTLGEKLLQYAGKARGLPSDLARNHDHYLYGVPKK